MPRPLQNRALQNLLANWDAFEKAQAELVENREMAKSQEDKELAEMAAAEIPVSTAATVASTANFLRCHDAARASACSGRRRVEATDGMGGAVRMVLACGWSRLNAKDAEPNRARRPQG